MPSKSAFFLPIAADRADRLASLGITPEDIQKAIKEQNAQSPAGRIGATTGAVLCFGDAGALVLPLLFSGALTVTGGYGTGFLVGGTLALLYGLSGLRRRR